VNIPLPENDLPGLEPLLNSDLWQDWASREKVGPLNNLRDRVSYLKLKPNHSCRLVIRGNREATPSKPPDLSLVILLPRPERAQEVFDKAMTRVHLVPDGTHGPFLSLDPPAVVMPYTSDPDLPAARHVFEPDRFRRSLARLIPDFDEKKWRIKRRSLVPNVVAYKPGRRVVHELGFQMRHRADDFRVNHHWHMKIERPTDSGSNFEKLTAIAAATRGAHHLRVPELVGHSSERNLTVVNWKAGTLLDCAAASSATLAEIGRCVAELHGLELEVDHTPSPVEESQALTGLEQALSHLAPDLEEGILDASHRLRRFTHSLTVTPSSAVHGDLHRDQILVEPEGTIRLLDFDRAGRGYAALDVGSLARSIREVGGSVDSFLEGYDDLAPRRLEKSTVIQAEAMAGFKRLGEPFRSLDPDWPQTMKVSLDRVQRLLDEAEA